MPIRWRSDRQDASSAARWMLFLPVSMGLGAAVAYLLDPSLGKRRRAWAKDKAMRMARLKARGVRALEHDLSNRAHGVAARLRAMFKTEEADDEVVRERVRAAIGRVCAHAGAIEVSVAEGTVRLSGPIIDRDHGQVLRKVGRVPGVRTVEDELSRHL